MEALCFRLVRSSGMEGLPPLPNVIPAELARSGREPPVCGSLGQCSAWSVPSRGREGMQQLPAGSAMLVGALAYMLLGWCRVADGRACRCSPPGEARRNQRSPRQAKSALDRSSTCLALWPTLCSAE